MEATRLTSPSGKAVRSAAGTFLAKATGHVQITPIGLKAQGGWVDTDTRVLVTDLDVRSGRAQEPALERSVQGDFRCNGIRIKGQVTNAPREFDTSVCAAKVEAVQDVPIHTDLAKMLLSGHPGGAISWIRDEVDDRSLPFEGLQAEGHFPQGIHPYQFLLGRDPNSTSVIVADLFYFLELGFEEQISCSVITAQTLLLGHPKISRIGVHIDVLDVSFSAQVDGDRDVTRVI